MTSEEAERNAIGSDLLRHLGEEAGRLSRILFGWSALRLRLNPAARISPEDLVQETWSRAIAATTSGRADLPTTANARAWLIGIARHVILEELRRPGSFAAQPESSTRFPGDVIDTVTSICTRLQRDELVERFLGFADGLEEADRQLLVRCALEGGRPEEVAPRIALEPDSAVRRWHRLRERLREAGWEQRLGLGS
ncbi:MAG: sigma-70 family RNA polymerase sigma factor [Planctomycetota bacterium]